MLLVVAAIAVWRLAERPEPPPAGTPPAQAKLEFDPAALLATNPLPDSPAVLSLGQRLYAEACVECHGLRGAGDGPSAGRVYPRPADLRSSGVVDSHSDAWLFLRITKGKLGTSMPSFGPTYTEKERWSLVRYLRRLVRH